ncbi:unnamed protein product [Oncorhynchus mykiss]|uniref:Uncharacterized protein n=1 Tax=Oncorhynchus mykiss TaxID=8022 RepID=A0A060WC28_ONCMY|nr:unnamed protein product [Oncorhynchus mykiss]
MLPLCFLLRKHGIQFNCYASMQFYIKTTLDSLSSINTPTSCLDDIKAWMSINRRQLNNTKTEAILIGTHHLTKTSPITTLTLGSYSTSHCPPTISYWTPPSLSQTT